MNRQTKILLVEDDPILRETLREQMAMEPDFVLETAFDAKSALALAVSKNPAEAFDLVVMDIGLPDMDGREAVRALRIEGFSGPILILTGQDSEADEILGLSSGANDYVTKPFRYSALMARIKLHLRQHEASDEAVLHLGAFVFQPRSKLIINGKGHKFRLTEKETAILRYLYRASGATVPRDVLLREIWGYNAKVTTHTLETHIYRLRQKIEADPDHVTLLLTDLGGYRLNLEKAEKA